MVAKPLGWACHAAPPKGAEKKVINHLLGILSNFDGFALA